MTFGFQSSPYFRVVLPIICLAFCPLIQAQTAASLPQHSASCKINTSEPTEAEIAFARYDFKKAQTLFAAAYAKDPTDLKSRQMEIDSLLGQNKIDDARKKTDAWTAADSNSARAILTASELRFAEGDWPESYGLALRAAKANPCLAEAYDNMAHFETAAGFRATAASHLHLAHQLAPNDPTVRGDWIRSLPLEQRIAEREKFFETSKTITDKERPVIAKTLKKMAALSDNRCELQSSTGSARIPMTLIERSGEQLWGLEIAFNGRKRVLQIDTGASGFVLTHGAGAVGLRPVDTSRVGGFGNQGSSGVTLNRADSVHIGGLEFKNCVVETLQNSGILGGEAMGLGERLDFIDGLVGSDIFDRYLVTLDYIKHEVRLEPLPQNPAHPLQAALLDPLGGSNDPDRMLLDRYTAPSMQSWTKIYRQDHAIIMPAYLHTDTKGGHPVLFVVDTGSFSNLVDLNAIKEFSTTQDTGGYAQGLSGVQKLYEAGKFTVDFAGLRLPVKNMDSTDLSRFGGGIMGFFGFPTLQQLVMHIDYRDNLAYFEAPNGKH